MMIEVTSDALACVRCRRIGEGALLQIVSDDLVPRPNQFEALTPERPVYKFCSVCYEDILMMRVRLITRDGALRIAEHGKAVARVVAPALVWALHP